MTEASTNIAEMTFEAARDELAQVVQQLESGNAPLAESLRLWERGEALAQHCEKQLVSAKERLESARQAALTDSDGSGDAA